MKKIQMKKAIVGSVFVAMLPLSFPSIAYVTDEVVGKVAEVAVNGGADTANPGTTCMKLDVAVASSCPGGYVAIPNNNSKLVNAASLAKVSTSTVSLYYMTDSSPQHCPNRVFTPSL